MTNSTAHRGAADPVSLRAYLLNGGMAIFLTGLVLLIMIFGRFGNVQPIEGTLMITEAVLCPMPLTTAACDTGTPVTLPYNIPARGSADIHDLRFRITAELDGLKRPLAIFLPRVKRSLEITANGTIIQALEPLETRQWNRSILVDINEATAPENTIVLDLRVQGFGQEGLQLWPVFLGPSEILTARKILRDRIAIDLAVFAQAMSVLLFFGHLIVRRALPDEEIHLWLAASALCAIVFLSHFTTPVALLPYPLWTVIWTTMPALYVLFLLKFVTRFFGVKLPMIEASFTLLIGLSFLYAATIMPEGYALLYGAALNSTNIFFGTVVLTTFWVHRRNMGQGTFVLFFFCFCVPLAAGMFEIVLTLSPTALTPLSLFHLAPVFLASVAIYLFISQLITAMKTSKARAGELERLAEEIQAELALSYETLAREREKSAIDKERSRILLDLHDGVGGILANTIAYIDNHGRGDDVIRASLSEALRDLGLMLDGLENSHSLATLFGMIRERLEPLMNDHNLSFDWQVEEEPQIPHQGPSHNLAVARIVQEAITNTIKHANASSIRIYTQQDLVRVSDDGRGFDVTAEPRQGYGLMGMRRRAADLGIGLEIKSGQSGTQISLFLNPQTV